MSVETHDFLFGFVLLATFATVCIAFGWTLRGALRQ